MSDDLPRITGSAHHILELPISKATGVTGPRPDKDDVPPSIDQWSKRLNLLLLAVRLANELGLSDLIRAHWPFRTALPMARD